MRDREGSLRTRWNTPRSKNLNRSRPFAADMARLQVHIPDDCKFPGEELIELVYPRPDGEPDSLKPYTFMKAVISNHPDAAAQQVHHDQKPYHNVTTRIDVEFHPGSAIIALYTTRIFIFPMSNNARRSRGSSPLHPSSRKDVFFFLQLWHTPDTAFGSNTSQFTDQYHLPMTT
jgi:hypothetical protein